MATKVLIIAGGLTYECDVSVYSGHRVMNILTQFGYDVRISDVDALPADAVSFFSPGVMRPLAHGSVGEGGSLQSFLGPLGIPSVGSSSVQAMLASNRPTTKALLGPAGLTASGWVALPQAIFCQLGVSHMLSALESSISFPVVIKPTDGDSALGISAAQDAKAPRHAIVGVLVYGQRLIAEQHIDDRNVAVSVVGPWDDPVALPPVEVSTGCGRYDHDARYTTDEMEYFAPARLSDELLADLQATTVKAHTTLGLHNLSRMDFAVDDEDTCWSIDANVAPDMADTSLLPQTADALEDSSFAQLCADIADFVAGGRDVHGVANAFDEQSAGTTIAEDAEAIKE